LLLNLQINQKLTYLFISHDLAVVAHIADRIGIMYQGEIVEIGTTAEIMQAAKHSYTKLLLESNVIK
jgi:ABC-type oligopeptide transport system ATPase subunit